MNGSTSRKRLHVGTDHGDLPKLDRTNCSPAVLAVVIAMASSEFCVSMVHIMVAQWPG
ncbi:hypothetical protein CC86DRAFT_371913 [Ophiobolus disseminans]|uniref:Uncharacterized protein n=1 Tax=Ophiobolus disseminans TaxID=1469910 RepID=A0A6A6ZRE0_9PLEO|nr:hypothetical protein CC86DRAFT_371913 [Ophiobolus disseminans]